MIQQMLKYYIGVSIDQLQMLSVEFISHTIMPLMGFHVTLLFGGCEIIHIAIILHKYQRA